jgi:hypothetical protein
MAINHGYPSLVKQALTSYASLLEKIGFLSRCRSQKNPIPQYFGPKINRKNRIFKPVSLSKKSDPSILRAQDKPKKSDF